MRETTETDSTNITCASQRRQLVDILEGYMADLERGVAPDHESVLAAHPELADELRPYLDSLRLLHEATRDLRATNVATNGTMGELTGPQARQIGDYQIVREIGRGGMGIVYEAHQKSLNRQVAVKILPFAAVLDQRQIARFRNEAQAAAQLHHPHIVPVFAVGQEQGVYYYAMQYIDGQSLEQAIRELRKSPDRTDQLIKPTDAVHGSTATAHAEPTLASSSLRSNKDGNFFRTVARLGKEAAEGLQHAHEYGIVHRDVKPSNLLIDERGKLWVADFGLARIQSDSGVTLTGDVVGTLRYMSPEQASGRAALVDARTDVYSLGVTLYELLTHQTAYAGDDRQTLMRQILDEEPLAPRRLNPNIPIDLETIVLTAMAKAREERYVSAQAMADDLERFLSGKPTLARRPTLVDRSAKWARRHRPLVAVGACSLVLLVLISTIGMVLLAREQARTSAALAEAQQNAERVQESLNRAERHFLQARGVVDQFGSRFADRLLEIPGTETLRRDLLADTLGYYRQFLSDAGNDPQLQQELARAHFKSGVIAAKLGSPSDAISEYQAAQASFAKLASLDAAQTEPQVQLALAHNNLGVLFAARGKVNEAREHYTQAIAVQQQLIQREPQNPAFAGQLAESRANLGMLLDQTGDAKGAEESLRAAVALLRPLSKSLKNEPKNVRELAIACNNLSYLLRRRDVQEAETMAREAVRLLQQITEEFPNRDPYQDDLALCCNNLAAIESSQQRLSEAIHWHEQAISLQERLVRKAPGVVRHRSDLAISRNNLGVVYCQLRQAKEADVAFGRAREIFTTLADDYPDELAYRSSLAALLNNQALALAGTGRNEDALEIYRTAIESQRICWQRLPHSPAMREVLSKMLYNHGQSLRAACRWQEAAEATLSRREVWQADGERLLGVAIELAEIGEESRKGSDPTVTDALRQKWDDEIVATLWLVQDSGSPIEMDLANDKRFAHLHKNERFRALLVKRDNLLTASTSNQTDGSITPSSLTN